MQDFPALEEVVEVRERIRASVHHTPLVSTGLLSRMLAGPPGAGGALYLKAENLQKTGSFKVRGALNRMLTMAPEVRRTGVVTVSAGNHAQALAWAARETGAPCTVVMPDSAPRSKVRASRSYGAEVILHGTVFDAFQHALFLAEEKGLTFVHPFDDPAIIAGQGTVGLEILEDLPEVGTVVVPIGGGGLIAGVSAALARGPRPVRVIGVEPEGAAVMRKSLDAGEPVRLERTDTIADGLASPMAGALTYQYVSAFVEDVVTVTDDEIRRAMTLILSRTKLLVEPGGAAAVAALLFGHVTPSGPTVAILSGGNVDLESLGHLLLPES